jgi:hypothetical protein
MSAELDAKKQLLVAQAEFDRLKFALAVHDVKRLVRPTILASARPAAHSAAARILGFALPAFGLARMGRVVRALSIALSIYRFMRGFRGR